MTAREGEGEEGGGGEGRGGGGGEDGGRRGGWDAEKVGRVRGFGLIYRSLYFFVFI